MSHCANCDGYAADLGRALSQAVRLRARLAEVEAERDFWKREQRASENLASEATRRLAEVIAVPYCRDAGHTEAIHAAAGCCDPYEEPCPGFAGSS